MNEIQKKRVYFINKWVNELSIKLNKSKEELLAHGLLFTDFGDNNVFIEYEDGSSSFYKDSFYVENDNEYAIFTEHCDYHEFKKEWLADIQEAPNVNINKLVRIKWAGNGIAYIERGNDRLYLDKLELKSLENELDQFIHYYGEDFSPKQLNLDIKNKLKHKKED